MHTEGFTIFSSEFCQVPSYMPSSPLGVYKPLLRPNSSRFHYCSTCIATSPEIFCILQALQ